MANVTSCADLPNKVIWFELRAISNDIMSETKLNCFQSSAMKTFHEHITVNKRAAERMPTSKKGMNE